jgi:aryl-alcohol dehydrogenase-like predicted oxidoreductase
LLYTVSWYRHAGQQRHFQVKTGRITLPIPGTSKVKHLEENTAAALLNLDDSIMEELANT